MDRNKTVLISMLEEIDYLEEYTKNLAPNKNMANLFAMFS